MNINARSSCYRIAFATLAAICLTGCSLIPKGTSAAREGYCAAWPRPPLIASSRDTAATIMQADRLNNDWKRRCPDNWARFKDGLGAVSKWVGHR